MDVDCINVDLSKEIGFISFEERSAEASACKANRIIILYDV
jgi:hypothetical protein